MHMACRCRGWEEGSPFAELFGSYEAEVGRLEAAERQLREENATLARLLAEAELAAALGPTGKAGGWVASGREVGEQAWKGPP